MALNTLLLCGVVSYLTWQEGASRDQWTATGAEVFQQREIWRLFTTTFAHGDLEHLLSNSYMLGILVYFVHGHFGVRVFPVASLLAAALINALALITYSPQIRLVGASGLVYFLAGFWLTMFIAIERQRRFPARLLRAVGVGLVILFPTTFEPRTSYRTHLIGVIIGILFAWVYFVLNQKEIQSAEVHELVEE